MAKGVERKREAARVETVAYPRSGTAAAAAVIARARRMLAKLT
jgi:hypothetical protein